MYMVTGGRYQGKLEYACRVTGLTGSDFLDAGKAGQEDIFRAKGICGFQLYVRRFLMDKEEKELEAFAQELSEKNPDLVIVTDEIGCGIVPLDGQDRKYRENAGRVCTELAKRSGRVDRVVCGIGMVLKDLRNSS